MPATVADSSNQAEGPPEEAAPPKASPTIMEEEEEEEKKRSFVVGVKEEEEEEKEESGELSQSDLDLLMSSHSRISRGGGAEEEGEEREEEEDGSFHIIDDGLATKPAMHGSKKGSSISLRSRKGSVGLPYLSQGHNSDTTLHNNDTITPVITTKPEGMGKNEKELAQISLSHGDMDLLLSLLEERREVAYCATAAPVDDDDTETEGEDKSVGDMESKVKARNQKTLSVSNRTQTLSVSNIMDDYSVRDSVVRKVQQQESASTSSLHHDTFAFFITAPVFSTPMALAGSILFLQGSVFALMLLNAFEYESKTNPFGIPSGVSFQAILGQFLALFLAVIVQNDFSTALIYLHEGWLPEGIGSAFAGGTRAKWICGIVLQFFLGALALGTTFLLIVSTDDVVEILLNFAAIEFITLVDNAAFHLATYGFFGNSIRLEAKYVIEAEYVIPKQRCMSSPLFRVVTFIGCYLILLIAWVVVYTAQLRGQFTSKTLYVQFEDYLAPEMSAYSGFYELEILWGRFDITRHRYTAVNSDGFLGYCRDERAWTFTINGEDSCDEILAQSLPTKSFDVTQTASATGTSSDIAQIATASATTNGGWLVVQADRRFPMQHFSLELGCGDDIPCGGGECNIWENRCECDEGFSGPRCHSKDDELCETLAVNEQFATFRNSRDFASRLELLKDAGGKLVQVYHHPVYYHEDKSGIQLLMYLGYRWGLTHSLVGLPGLQNHTKDGLVEYLTNEVDFHASEHLDRVEFLSAPVLFDSPEDNHSPVGLSWWAITGDFKDSAAEQIAVTSQWLCAGCNNSTNPCRNSNICTASGQCDCVNGAEGTLCQILPLRNGRCDLHFNTPSFDYDGGDCCKLSCMDSTDSECGVTPTEAIGGVELGFPFCADPSVIVTPCNATDCWARSVQNVGLLSVLDRPNTLLSANGRILVVSEPSLDVVRVFDLEESEWVQRGPAVIGPPSSKFGKLLAVATLPSSIVGRRVGKVPLLMAIGIQGLGAARVRVAHWEPDAIDWISIGDDIDVCHEIRSSCELKSIDVARYGSRVTVSVVRTDNIALVYRTTISTSERETWTLMYYRNAQSSSRKMTSTSLTGDGVAVAFGRELILEHYILTDDLSFVNEANLMNASQQLGFYKDDVLAFSPLMRNAESGLETVRANRQTNWPTREGEDIEISSLKLSHDHNYAYLNIRGAYGHDFVVRYVGTGKPGASVLIGGLNFTSPHRDANNDIPLSQFSAEGSVFALYSGRPNSTQNDILVYEAYDRIGSTLDGSMASYSISDSADVYVQGERGAESFGYETRSKCGTANHLQVALRLDQSPRNVSWKLETYQVFRSRVLRSRLIKGCENCYFDNSLFGNGIVLESICLLPEQERCSFFRYQAAHGQTSGAGVVLFKNGKEIFSYAGDSKDEVDFFLGDQQCEVNETICGANQSHILIEASFDGRPQAVYWTLFDEDGNVITQRERPTNSYDYGDVSTTYLFQACAPINQQYTFVIEDNDRDGLCCDRGEGGFILYVDHNAVYERKGRRKFRKETIVFNSTHVIDEPQPLLIEIQFDENSRRIGWHIADMPSINLTTVNRTFVDGEFRFAQATTSKNQPHNNRLITEDVYLTVGQQYWFSMYDTRGDGLCCDYGEGYFNVYFGLEADPSKKLIEGLGNFSAVSSLGRVDMISYPNQTRTSYCVVPFIFSLDNVLEFVPDNSTLIPTASNSSRLNISIPFE